ncbi:MAG: GIY-YIG nuclease family protein [Erysipelotrichales bacterium]|nr:GIY-YIG nuclease family protein [Erysipelotrichales bacterium]
MKVNKLIPKIEKKTLFLASHEIHVPDLPGCYVITTMDDDILYIGKADRRISERFKQHIKNKDKKSITQDGLGYYFYYLVLETKDCVDVENSWLMFFQNYEGRLPILNKINSPIY